jgi:hypothetical protein
VKTAFISISRLQGEALRESLQSRFLRVPMNYSAAFAQPSARERLQRRAAPRHRCGPLRHSVNGQVLLRETRQAARQNAKEAAPAMLRLPRLREARRECDGSTKSAGNELEEISLAVLLTHG